MHLEKIEIFGFKSFADKTTITFDQPITAIVGPNGCGKSNVVDAFRWVLGGPTAKSLRSDKMTDVIFSGTEKRSPLNFAQISLTFTQIDPAMSVDYQELCITRKLYRNGESEYYINRNPVRLKDIHKLLWEAGLGKNAFYIFEQGKIDELIVSTPLERRAIFEEAAKIMHFKEKRKESLRKLEQVEANLKRVLDIQNEVNKQIETLKKQAEEAKIYKEQKELLTKLERDLLVAKWKNNDQKQKQYDLQLQEKIETSKKIKVDLLNADAKLKAAKDKHYVKSVSAKTAYEEFFEAKKSKELHSFEYKNHLKRQNELLEQSQALKEGLQQFHHKHLQEQKVYSENLKKLETYQADISSLVIELENTLKITAELEVTVNQESLARKEGQKELMEAIREENTFHFELKNTWNQIENSQNSFESFSKQNQVSDQKLQDKNSLISQLEKDLSTLTQDKEQIDQRLAENSKRNEALLKEIKEQKEKLKNIVHELTKKKTKVDLLQKLKDEHDGYDRCAKTLLGFAKNASHPLFEKITPLTEWIIPKLGYEHCISTILAPYLQTLVVKNKGDLELLLQTAGEKNLQGFSLLCLEEIQTNIVAENQVIAQNNVVADHFLKEIQEKESLDDLKMISLISKLYFVDEKNVLHSLSQDKHNLFLREKELRESYKELLVFEEQSTTLNQELSQKELSAEKLRAEIVNDEKNRQKLDYKKAELQYSLKKNLEDVTALEEACKEFIEKKEKFIQNISQLKSRHQELVDQHQSAKNKRLELETNFNKIENQFEKNFNLLTQNRSLKQSLEDKQKRLERETQTLREHVKVFESKSKDFEEQIEEMNSKIEKTHLAHLELESLIPTFIEKEQEHLEALQLAQEHYHSFEDALEKLEQEQKSLEESLVQLRQELEELQKNDAELANLRSQAIAENNLYFTEIQEKYQMEERDLIDFAIDTGFSVSKVERETRNLRKGLENYTEINLKAVSDCEEQKERFEFLQSQIDDLNLSQTQLIDIIKELDETSRKIFSETFENIRTHFKANYALLFNGGVADLQLNHEEDVLEAGIEIIAQPPGKKMRSIQQLSGGEKCLTALALLFALFETQSIPFCILDEIDAPLDDTNVERFTKVLKQFVKNHQFIIITHNKRTMAMADRLLGISMQEKGVTKVIPLEFENQTSQETNVALAH